MKKVLNILLALVITIGIVVTIVIGLNFSLIYRVHTKVDINIGKSFEIQDVENIVKEIIGDKKEVVVQKVEIYEDIATISVEDISQEQLEQLNTKINEKYEKENKVEDMLVTRVDKLRGRQIVKPYILPVVISIVIILAYMTIRYKKLGIGRVLLRSGIFIVLAQLLYLALLAITRIPINGFTMPFSMAIYIVSCMLLAYQLEKELNTKKEETKKA